VIDASALRVHCHEVPPDWPADLFNRVTDAIADALVAAWQREHRPTERPA
jgi:hypothetical protein